MHLEYAPARFSVQLQEIVFFSGIAELKLQQVGFPYPLGLLTLTLTLTLTVRLM
jgi:hypothetical protein